MGKRISGMFFDCN